MILSFPQLCRKRLKGTSGHGNRIILNSKFPSGHEGRRSKTAGAGSLPGDPRLARPRFLVATELLGRLPATNRVAQHPEIIHGQRTAWFPATCLARQWPRHRRSELAHEALLAA